MKSKIRQHLAALLILASLIFITFLPCLKNNFVYWDEDQFLLKDPLIKDFTLSGFIHLFDPHTIGQSVPASIYSSAASYIPLTLLSYSVEYHFFQFNPFIYHLDNLILHILNAILVYSLIYLLIENIEIAFITALFFGIMPLRVESVAWVMERKDVLFAFFYLSGLILYIRYLKSNSLEYFLGTAALFIYSLFAKPQGLSFPLTLLLIDYYFKRNLSRALILEKAVFLFLNVVFWLLFLKDLSQVSLSAHGATIELASYTLVLYLIKSFVPFGLSCINPVPGLTNGFFPWTVYASIGLVAFAAWWVVKYFSKNQREIFCLLFYIVLMILPILNMEFVHPTDTQFNHLLFYEHYTYLPCIGLYFLFAMLFVKYKILPVQLRDLILFSVTVYVLLMGWISLERCGVWKDGIALWSDAIDHASLKDPVYVLAYINRGNLYNVQGKFDEALYDYNQAIDLDAQYPESYANRGVIYGKNGEFLNALADFNRAIQLNPHLASAYFDRAVTYMKLGNPNQARIDYQRFQQLNT